MSQTTSSDELGGFQQAESLSPEELLQAVRRIKREPADPPPAEENGGGTQRGEGEEARLEETHILQNRLFSCVPHTLLSLWRISHFPSCPPGPVLRGDLSADLQATRNSSLCLLAAGGGLVPGLQSYLLASGGRSSPGGSSLHADSPPSHPPTEEELEEDYYGNGVQSRVHQHIYGHPGNPYSKL